MTKTISVNDVSIQAIIALTKNGDEIVLEENGEPLAKITPVEKSETKQRVLGSGKGEGYFMSDDFDEEISLWENASDGDFTSFEKELAGEKIMARGDVLLISLPTSDGREQSGKRPAIAVQTDVAATQKTKYFLDKLRKAGFIDHSNLPWEQDETYSLNEEGRKYLFANS